MNLRGVGLGKRKWFRIGIEGDGRLRFFLGYGGMF